MPFISCFLHVTSIISCYFFPSWVRIPIISVQRTNVSSIKKQAVKVFCIKFHVLSLLLLLWQMVAMALMVIFVVVDVVVVVFVNVVVVVDDEERGLSSRFHAHFLHSRRSFYIGWHTRSVAFLNTHCSRWLFLSIVSFVFLSFTLCC